MNGAMLYALVGIGLFCIGLYALIVHEHLLRKILAINVMGSAVFLEFVALAQRMSIAPDPVPQAMVITGIVIAVAATAFAIALTLKVAAEAGHPELANERRE
jgi:multicomponent Na+:H+ antiporter subunit C